MSMRIAVFGGAFDPLHKEHIRIIDGAKSLLKMDKVLLLPTYNPPHKDGASVSYEHRVEMLRLFALSRPYVEIDETEKAHSLEKSYAYIVLAEIKKRYPTDDLYYIIGSDSLRKLTSWARPDELLKSVKIIVITRGEDDVSELINEYSERFGGEISVGFGAESESSSSIRFMLEIGAYDELKGRIDDKILDYIIKNNLYSRYADVVEKLKSTLSERTFRHSLRVAEFAVENAWRVWEDYDRALLAGLLHDCAKGQKPIKNLDAYDTNSPEVIHQYDGALIARREYGIVDNIVLDAIRYHTTAKPNFSSLGKLLYLADKLERGRDYPSVERLRSILEKEGVDACFKETLAHSIEYLRASDKEIDLLTLRAYEWYNR